MKRTFNFCFAIFTFYFLLFTSPLYAKEITILYTGETHAMLYPCNCPQEPDGGIARRATLIKQLKKENPDCLILDAGDFFAGGPFDEYTQNTELDTQRTLVNLKAMELMHYDALAIGDDEFNFGRQFLKENIQNLNLNFLSCNIKADKIAPYYIKDVSGTKIGIIAVTSLKAKPKAGGFEFIEPKAAVERYAADLRKNGAHIIVLLSHLSEAEELNLVSDIKGIDILIASHSPAKKEPSQKVSHTLILKPSWQGRSLGKLSLKVEDNKIIGYKVDELRLSDKIKDDPDVTAILPRCFSDTNCRKENLLGLCEEPGSLSSRCLFTKPNKIKLLIVTSKDCVTCDTEKVVKFFKKQFPGLVTSFSYYPESTSARKLVKDFAIAGLPAYFLGKEAEKEKNFDSLLKASLEPRGDFYMLKPQSSGFSYFLNRKKIKGRLDLFLSLYNQDSKGLLGVVKEFNPALHFLAVEQKDKFDAPAGNLEAEEDLRAVCVQKYYPEKFWDYISCREKFIDSSWWEDCLTGLDTNKIKACAKGTEGIMLLRDNIALNKEIQVMFGPTYLLDNQEIFSSRGIPSQEELRKIIKKR